MTGVEPCPVPAASESDSRTERTTVELCQESPVPAAMPSKKETTPPGNSEWKSILRQKSHRQQPSFERNDSTTSNYCYTTGCGGSGSTSGRCLQRILTEQCRRVRQRRQFDQMTQWCVREGLFDLFWQRSIDHLSRRSSRPSSALIDVDSLCASMSDLSSAAAGSRNSDLVDAASLNAQLIDRITDDGFGDEDEDDSDEDSDPEDLERIPDRFRYPADADNGSTTAGEMFWNSRRSSLATITSPTSLFHWACAAGVSSPGIPQREQRRPPLPVTTTPGNPLMSRLNSLTNTQRRAFTMTRQYALSHDIVHPPSSLGNDDASASHPVLHRARTFPARYVSADLTLMDETDEIADGDLDISVVATVAAGLATSSPETSSDDAQSIAGSGSDQTAKDAVTPLVKDRLRMVLELLNAGIPINFWPQLRHAES